MATWVPFVVKSLFLVATFQQNIAGDALAKAQSQQPEDSSTLQFTRRGRFIRCMGGCLSHLEKEIRVVAERCGRRPLCWKEAAGRRANRCVAKCTLHDVGLVPFVTALETSFEAAKMSPDSSSAVHPDMLDCLEKCAGQAYQKMGSWTDECKQDSNCWEMKLGQVVLQCAERCQKDEVLQPGSQIPVASKLKDAIPCTVQCFERSRKELLQISNKCQRNIDCWMPSIAPIATKCLQICFEPVAKEQYEIDLSQLHDFFPCLLQCIESILPQVFQIIEECKMDIQCMLSKLMQVAFSCLTKCFMPSPTTAATPSDAQLDVISLRERVETDLRRFLTKTLGFQDLNQPQVTDMFSCILQCVRDLVTQIPQIMEECHMSIQCMLTKVMQIASSCVMKCIMTTTERNIVFQQKNVMNLNDRIEADFKSFLEVVTTKKEDLAHCAVCLGRSEADVEKTAKKCKADVNCWIKDQGPQVLKCVDVCIHDTASARKVEQVSRKPKKISLRRRVEVDLKSILMAGTTAQKDKPAKVGGILQCAVCLGKTVAEIIDIAGECKLDFHCWMEKLGPQLLQCLGQCLHLTPEEERLVTIPSQSDVQCLASGLGTSAYSVFGTMARCHHDVACWYNTFGEHGLKVIKTCASKP